MTYNLNVRKLITDLKGPNRAQALRSEFNKVANELNTLTAGIRPQAEARLKEIEKRYQTLVNRLHSAQKELDQEVGNTIVLLRKQAKEVEKNLSRYKKLALSQRAKLKTVLAKKKTSKKKATPRKTSVKRASKKTAAASTTA